MKQPDVRAERAWVGTHGRYRVFVSGPLFTPYQKLLTNFECLCQIQRPRKPPKTRFCDLKRVINGIIVRIVNTRSMFEFRAATTFRISPCSLFVRRRYEGYLQWKFQPNQFNTCLSIWAKEEQEGEDKTNMSAHMDPKTRPCICQTRRLTIISAKDEFFFIFLSLHRKT